MPFSSLVLGSEVLKGELLVGGLSEPNVLMLFFDVGQMVLAL